MTEPLPTIALIDDAVDLRQLLARALRSGIGGRRMPFVVQVATD